MIIVQNAFAFLKNFVLLDFIHQLEMAIAMMIQILLSVAMTMEIAVCLMLLQIIAQNALVIIKRLVLLDFFLLQLEMEFVMMKPTMFTATMMALTAVDHHPIQKSVQNAGAMVS